MLYKSSTLITHTVNITVRNSFPHHPDLRIMHWLWKIHQPDRKLPDTKPPSGKMRIRTHLIQRIFRRKFTRHRLGKMCPFPFIQLIEVCPAERNFIVQCQRTLHFLQFLLSEISGYPVMTRLSESHILHRLLETHDSDIPKKPAPSTEL